VLSNAASRTETALSGSECNPQTVEAAVPVDSKESLIEFFRKGLPKLPKKLGYTRDFVLLDWRDLRLAIEECLGKQYQEGETPYVLTSVFMRNTRSQKNSLERVLAEQEKLDA
jgi:hypothetical protein